MPLWPFPITINITPQTFSVCSQVATYVANICIYTKSPMSNDENLFILRNKTLKLS